MVMRKTAIRTIILGRKTRVYFDKNLPLLMHYYSTSVAFTNYFLHETVGYDLNDAGRWIKNKW